MRGRIDPVRILQHKQYGTLCGKSLEETHECPERLLLLFERRQRTHLPLRARINGKKSRHQGKMSDRFTPAKQIGELVKLDLIGFVPFDPGCELQLLNYRVKRTVQMMRRAL